MSNYAQVSDVDNWPAGMETPEKQARLDRVEEEIERVTRDAFYVQTFDILVSGNGKCRLFPALHRRILSVTAITVDDEAVQVGSWSFDEFSVFRTDEGCFKAGVRNIRLQGTCGWPAVPAAIKQVTIILARDENDRTLYRHKIKGSESLGDYRYDNGAPVYTGVQEADEILGRYINRRGSFL
ncbi:MAG: hypothetical protein A2Y70_00635 [Candidatus Aminicenantes bacterium RBG_13_64_14]|nr:MAG: hypothetical protein A2Y70_00635 [Candidatus Aminicenantes bacterium RBG_13_64_14]